MRSLSETKHTECSQSDDAWHIHRGPVASGRRPRLTPISEPCHSQTTIIEGRTRRRRMVSQVVWLQSLTPCMSRYSRRNGVRRFGTSVSTCCWMPGNLRRQAPVNRVKLRVWVRCLLQQFP